MIHKKTFPKSIAWLVFLLAPGHRAAGYVEPWEHFHWRNIVLCCVTCVGSSGWYINTGSINGLVQSSFESLPDAMFIETYDNSGLGRVPDLWVRVQVRVLVICVITSTSTWLLHEYESESEYWLMSTSTSTSTSLWSTFYIGSRFLLFGLWQESPQILKNLGQSSNCPLSM